LKALEEIFNTFETWCFQQFEDLPSTHLKISMNQRTLSHTLQTWKLKFLTTRRTFFQTFSPWNLILSKS
jgi:hypothetical protein